MTIMQLVENYHDDTKMIIRNNNGGTIMIMRNNRRGTKIIMRINRGAMKILAIVPVTLQLISCEIYVDMLCGPVSDVVGDVYDDTVLLVRP